MDLPLCTVVTDGERKYGETRIKFLKFSGVVLDIVFRFSFKKKKKKHIGSISGALGCRFNSWPQHSGLRIRVATAASRSNCSSDLIPDPEISCAMGGQKRKKRAC